MLFSPFHVPIEKEENVAAPGDHKSVIMEVGDLSLPKPYLFSPVTVFISPIMGVVLVVPLRFGLQHQLVVFSDSYQLLFYESPRLSC